MLRLVLLLACLLSVAEGAGAQDIALADGGPRFLLASTGREQAVEIDPAKAPVFQRRITLALEQSTVGEALRELGRQAKIRLVYSRDVLDPTAPARIKAEGITVAAALTEILLGSGLDVVLSDVNRVTLAPRALPPPAPSGAIVGRVTDAKGTAPIGGATVGVEGTSLSATADNDGRYRIAEVPVGTYTVRARYIGYAPGTVSVTVSAEQEATADFSLEKSAQRLDEVVTTGTVVPTEVKALPTPVTVITSRDIEDNRQRDLHAIIRQSVPTAVGWDNPDVTPTETSFQLRGATTLAGPSGAVKVFVDGIEQADRSRGGVDPSSVERVEVIRGPQAATIYGSEAMGGVIQIFTKRGSEGPIVMNASAGFGAITTPYKDYGSALRQSYTGSLSGGSASTTFNLGGGFSHTGAYIPEGKQSNYGVYGSTHTSIGKFALDLSARYFMSDGRSMLPPTLLTSGFAYYSQPFFWGIKELNQTVGMRMSASPKPWWHHELSVGFDRSSYSLGQTRPRFTTPDDTLLFASEGSIAKTFISYNTSVRASFGPSVSSSVIAGVDHYSRPNTYFQSDGLPSTTGTLTPVSGYSIYGTRETSTNSGIFTQAQLELKDRVFLTAGLRAEQNSNFGDSLGTPVSPRLGISIVHSAGAALFKARSSWGRAIRAPGSGAKGGQVTSTGTRLANPLLGPERQQGWDAGIDVAIGQHGSIGATYFDQVADNLIQLVTLTATSSQNQNVGRIHNTGIELESWVDIGALRVRAQFGYSRARVVQLSSSYSGDLQVGDQVFNLPRYTAGASATFAMTRTTRLGAGLTYVGARQQYDDLGYFKCLGGTGPCLNDTFAYNRDYLISFPGFVKADISVMREFGESVSAFVRVDNLTDNSAAEFSNISIATGRITTVGLRWAR